MGPQPKYLKFLRRLINRLDEADYPEAQGWRPDYTPDLEDIPKDTQFKMPDAAWEIKREYEKGSYGALTNQVLGRVTGDRSGALTEDPVQISMLRQGIEEVDVGGNTLKFIAKRMLRSPSSRSIIPQLLVTPERAKAWIDKEMGRPKGMNLDG